MPYRETIAEYCAVVVGAFSVFALIAITSMYRGEGPDAVASQSQPIQYVEAR
jgi:hypothetical protein